MKASRPIVFVTTLLLLIIVLVMCSGAIVLKKKKNTKIQKMKGTPAKLFKAILTNRTNQPSLAYSLR